MKILKFGGKSLANGQPLNNVLEIIGRQQADGPLAVVVSARGATTDRLLQLYELASAGEEYEGLLEELLDYQKQPAACLPCRHEAAELSDTLAAIRKLRVRAGKLRDKVVAYGELFSAKLLVALLARAGIRAEFVDARNLLKVKNKLNGFTIDNDLSATLTRSYFKSLRPGQVPVITGFIASDERNDTVTLGRNGSNLTTSLIAGFVDASEVQNWTDVDGIYTAPPKYVPDARHISHLSYKEAYELANFGATILHPRTIEPLLTKNIPLRIYNSIIPNGNSTLIDKNGATKGIKAVSVVEDQALITLESSHFAGTIGIDARIFSALSRYQISVRLIAQASSEQGIGFIVDRERADQARQVLEEEFAAELQADRFTRITVNKQVAIIAILGRHNYALEKAIKGLRRNRIWMHLISNSISGAHISLVVDSHHLKKAVNVVHNQVFGVVKTLNLFAFGKGTVGGQLLDQVVTTTEEVVKRRGLRINLIGVADSQRAVIDEQGLGTDWRQRLQQSNLSAGLVDILKRLIASGLENLVIVDNTSSQQLADDYVSILEHGFDLVASNKKANSGSMAAYRAIRQVMQRRGRQFYYETNVGAGLPLIDTLRHLQDSADTITRVRGLFSGSLSYIFHRFSAGKEPFAEVLLAARKEGYTEPDPREDLQGEDVARKLVILARELGMVVELTDVQVQNLIPPALRQTADFEEFMQQQIHLNSHYEALRSELAEGEVWRYVGELDVAANRLQVQLEKVPVTSPLGSVAGADALFEIYTSGYGRQPIVIRGAGAGGEVTARGVYTDLLRLGKSY